jgi:quinoprotein glucose dehydrogenase
VIFPGFDGGAEWGGPAVDPVHGILYVNANDVAWTGMLLPNRPAASAAEGLYQAQCSACHGVDRAGSAPAFPSLLELGGRLSQAQIAQVIHDGRGRMPPFPALSGTALAGLLQWLNPQSSAGAGMSAPLSPEAIQAPYRFTGYAKFLDPDGYPAVLPPWGTLSAIDLNTGASLWRVPLGEYPELRAQGLPVTGSENYGGPILTASGVLFIGATVYDHKIRAFESSSGRLLWESELPFAGTATPATYLVDGRQYLVIATSNARNRNGPQGGAYVAFALPGGT